jgi:predicted MPP superfamily phosphohydrolase
MIRILYMSDLHLEMERWRLSVPGWADFMARHRGVALHPARGPMLNDMGKADLIVLAGDIHNGYRGVIYADHVARYLGAPVVMVAGNHEFYHHDTEILLPALRAAAAKTQGRVQFLENAQAVFDFPAGRVNVLGCTLWTDYMLNNMQQISMFRAQSRMNDHKFITTNKLPFGAADALARHEVSRRWLHRTLAQNSLEIPAAKNLIVTHHAPDAAFLGERTGEIAPAYASDLLDEFSRWRPAAWIHGHTHYRHSSLLHGIRVVSAPRGYVVFDGAKTLNYQPGLIEI